MTINLNDLIGSQQPIPPPAYPPGPGGHPWPKLNLDIFDAIADGTRNIAVQAVAGSGKTTTLKAGCMMVPRHESIVALAFNKEIAQTLEQALPKHVLVKTFHALGLSVLRRNNRSFEVEGGKLRSILKAQVDSRLYTDMGEVLVSTVSALKRGGVGITGPITADHAYEHLKNADYDLMSYTPQQLAQLAVNALRTSNNGEDTVDFDDMLYLPFIRGYKWPTFDRVFVDECQDLDPLQHEIIAQIASGQLICVGDRAQAIYGFRGADSESMDNLIKRFDMLELPLSVTYRCPTLVVDRAREIVGDNIQPRPAAPAGQVEHLNEMPALAELKHGDMILCRNNAPLVSLGMEMLAKRIPFQMRSNLEKTLIAFIRSLEKQCRADPSISAFRTSLEAWRETELDKAEKEGRLSRAAAVTDRADSLLAFIDYGDCDTIADLLHNIQRLFAGRAGPILSTIHKAKGLEAESVYLYQPDLLPSRFAKSDSQLQQEDNLLYVAITRAKHALYYVYVNKE